MMMQLLMSFMMKPFGENLLVYSKRRRGGAGSGDDHAGRLLGVGLSWHGDDDDDKPGVGPGKSVKGRIKIL